MLLSRAVHLREGEQVVLNTDILLASDSTSHPEQLIFTVWLPPQRGLLHTIQQPGVPLSRFTQLDVVAQRLRYTHDNSHSADTDSFR